MKTAEVIGHTFSDQEIMALKAMIVILLILAFWVGYSEGFKVAAERIGERALYILRCTATYAPSANTGREKEMGKDCE